MNDQRITTEEAERLAGRVQCYHESDCGCDFRKSADALRSLAAERDALAIEVTEGRRDRERRRMDRDTHRRPDPGEGGGVIYLQDPDVTLHQGNVTACLAELPDESVDCVVTSPPYWGLRDYGTGTWEGGDEGCEHLAPPGGGTAATGLQRDGRSEEARQGNAERIVADRRQQYRDVCRKCGARRVDNQIGLEETPDAYLARMVDVFREVRRVLAPHGTCWVNMGDGYANTNGIKNETNNAEAAEVGTSFRSGGYSRQRAIVPVGLKPKDLIGMPWRLALALQADGWWLRADIIWAKPNPMPESVTDRPTKAHEYVFLLTKQARYWYDADAVREPQQSLGETHNGKSGYREGHPSKGGISERSLHPAGRNLRTVWNIATQPYPEAHFACVDDQTEALTYSGWKRHEDLRDGEPIAMYDPATDSCRFSPATFHRYHFNGRLVAIEKRDTSQRLTPNHRCFVKRRSGWTGIVRADELVPGMEILTCAPIEVDEIEGVGERHASLLGWYTTEGSNHHDGYVSIYQSQSANPGHVATIRQLLSGVGATVKERTRTRDYRGRASIEVEFVVNGEVAYWLQACGKTLDPAAVRLPENEATALLDALIDGDGHRRKDGRSCIVQKDKTSIDRMQMLALRLGHRAVVSERKDGGHVLYLTRGRWLTLRGTNGQHVPIGREHYNGTVWCPKVATGLWLARRNGKPFITGNTFPERLPELCILAGCPERVCTTCGKPSERIVGRREAPDDVRRLYGRKSDYHTRAKGLGGQAHQDWLDAHPPETIGFTDCGHNAWRPGRVLDPFAGSGTTLHVARKHGRHSIGIELNPDYCELAARRLAQLSLLADHDAPAETRDRPDEREEGER